MDKDRRTTPSLQNAAIGPTSHARAQPCKVEANKRKKKITNQ
jgi:hypothetical protein